MKKIYDDLLEVVDKVIEAHNNSSDKLPEQSHYYFIQGLKVAKQLIDQEQDDVYEEYSYETLELLIDSLLEYGSIDANEIKEIAEDCIKKHYEE